MGQLEYAGRILGPEAGDFFDHGNERTGDRVGELVRQIGESTRKMLRRKIAGGFEAGSMRDVYARPIIHARKSYCGCVTVK